MRFYPYATINHIKRKEKIENQPIAAGTATTDVREIFKMFRVKFQKLFYRSKKLLKNYWTKVNLCLLFVGFVTCHFFVGLFFGWILLTFFFCNGRVSSNTLAVKYARRSWCSSERLVVQENREHCPISPMLNFFYFFIFLFSLS